MPDNSRNGSPWSAWKRADAPAKSSGWQRSRHEKPSAKSGKNPKSTLLGFLGHLASRRLDGQRKRTQRDIMKKDFSEMGKLSAAARRLPGHEKLKAEAIRMHVELDYGINAISPRIGINKISIRRWLIAAGCYRVGHRTTRVKNDGAKLIAYKASDLGRKQIYVHVWQRRAWQAEWKGVAKWDEAKHWHRHPAKQLYINAQTARKKHAWPARGLRENPSPG